MGTLDGNRHHARAGEGAVVGPVCHPTLEVEHVLLPAGREVVGVKKIDRGADLETAAAAAVRVEGVAFKRQQAAAAGGGPNAAVHVAKAVDFAPVAVVKEGVRGQ